MAEVNEENDPNRTDVGDFLKVFACTAVMLQTVLGFALDVGPSTAQQSWIIGWYNAVKFTAPAFIFGILYTTVRTTSLRTLHGDYLPYLQTQWTALFTPTIWWTLAYLVLMPSLQQRERFDGLVSFNWQFVNGNAAPHLWYNTMMLQFIILMPLFVGLTRWLTGHSGRGVAVSLITLVGYVWWVAIYDVEVFNGPRANDWYLLDRVFISFILYAIAGILLWVFRDQLIPLLTRWWWIAAVTLIWSWWRNNVELKSFNVGLTFANAPYLKPAGVVYALSAIVLIIALALWLIKRQSQLLPTVHFLAVYAYRAFLGNVFWMNLLWQGERLFGWQSNNALGARVAVTYVLGWAIAFGFAIEGHRLETWIKAGAERIYLKVEQSKA
ncbi:acyltransferase family protein [Furfurilactobacillus rossiae]|uniref:acyltransferase family protein n=1 Tax=Furfurilactobacillus rossiae TaxID=231049 RepID=UPI000313CF28|nr:acyltransferase family protein [Furfurilactobacillus rossiae]QFR67355.1 acyltransferase [Furfurilactobacillus rossiae]QLE60292.1 hypothetical protein LROSRS0_0244 [Furfurilactobacillus rossiae]